MACMFVSNPTAINLLGARDRSVQGGCSADQGCGFMHCPDPMCWWGFACLYSLIPGGPQRSTALQPGVGDPWSSLWNHTRKKGQAEFGLFLGTLTKALSVYSTNTVSLFKQVENIDSLLNWNHIVRYDIHRINNHIDYYWPLLSWYSFIY